MKNNEHAYMYSNRILYNFSYIYTCIYTDTLRHYHVGESCARGKIIGLYVCRLIVVVVMEIARSCVLGLPSESHAHFLYARRMNSTFRWWDNREGPHAAS